MTEIMQDYLRAIQNYAPLTFEEEQKLAKAWLKRKDKAACDKLMRSYMRLVVKVALGFRGYGLPVDELIQEGNIGLMQAINRFEPEKGFRLSTYAMWWIKAQIQEYVLNNWSLVKIGTSGTQKKLFFNLRRLRNAALEADDAQGRIHLSDKNVKSIAKKLGVSEADVIGMDQRLRHGDESLNVTLGDEDEGGNEWQDFLVEKRPNQEETYARVQLSREHKRNLEEALGLLNDRERAIFVARRLTDESTTPTLEELSVNFGISRERVRQLEERAFKKVQQHLIAIQPH